MRAGVYEARKRTPRPSVVYGGDGARGKKVAASLIRDAGFEPVDTGPLRMARYGAVRAPHGRAGVRRARRPRARVPVRTAPRAGM